MDVISSWFPDSNAGSFKIDIIYYLSNQKQPPKQNDHQTIIKLSEDIMTSKYVLYNCEKHQNETSWWINGPHCIVALCVPSHSRLWWECPEGVNKWRIQPQKVCLGKCKLSNELDNNKRSICGRSWPQVQDPQSVVGSCVDKNGFSDLNVNA